MRKSLLISALVLLTAGFACAQSKRNRGVVPTPNTLRIAPPATASLGNDLPVTQRTCGVTEQMRVNFAEHPELRATYEAHLEDVAQRISTGNFHHPSEGVVTIPVVVHVLYRTNQQNISTAQVQSQIDILNEDYRRQNSDASNTLAQFTSVAADVGIEFCLANRDPQGNPTDGILRTQTSTVNVGLTNNYYTESPAWNRNNYLNIWVCELGSQLLGFAQFPGTAPASRDGVVINWRFFGDQGTATAPYNKGRTATHEVGHWLGLSHIWGDGNCNVDDGISDTPLAGAANYNCSLNKQSCGSTDMVQNYMDYTEDACMNLFTQGQGAVMNATLSGIRGTLLSSDGCSNMPNLNAGCDTTEINYPLVGTPSLLAPTGPGSWGFVSGHNNFGDVSKAERTANTQGITEVFGVRIQFAFAASAGPTSKVTVHVWPETGGVPGAPLVSQDLLIDDIIAAQNDVTVMFPAPVPVNGPFFSGISMSYAAGDTVGIFTTPDSTVFPATAWEEWSGGAGWYAYSDSSSWGLFIGHAIFPIALGPDFTLQVAPANPQITTPGGSVALYASGAASYSWTPATGLSCTNCPNPIASPTTTTTYTVTGFDTSNTCSTTELVTIAVNLVGIEDALFDGEVSAFPNPSDGNFILEFTQHEIADLNIEIFNSLGQQVYREVLSSFVGTYRNAMRMEQIPAGVYHLRISDGERVYQQKLVFE